MYVWPSSGRKMEWLFKATYSLAQINSLVKRLSAHLDLFSPIFHTIYPVKCEHQLVRIHSSVDEHLLYSIQCCCEMHSIVIPMNELRTYLMSTLYCLISNRNWIATDVKNHFVHRICYEMFTHADPLFAQFKSLTIVSVQKV